MAPTPRSARTARAQVAGSGRQRLVIAGIVVAAAAAIGARALFGGGSMVRGELRAVVLPKAAGEPVTDADVRAVADLVDAALGEMGFERRDVSPIPGARIRIVIAELQAGRLPEIRKRLEDAKLRVRVE